MKLKEILKKLKSGAKTILKKVALVVKKFSKAFRKHPKAYLIGFGAVILVSATLLILYFTGAAKQERIFAQLQKDYHARQEATANMPQSLGRMLPQFTELYAQNEDLVGWLTIPGTSVDYPVMQSTGQTDTYQKRNFYGERSSHGSLYASFACDPFTPSDNVIIYGHNMKDGCMLAPLKNYQRKNYWENHKTITFDTLYETHTYEIFAVFTTSSAKLSGFGYDSFVYAYEEESFNAFVTSCKELSLYDTGITPQHGDKLLTLTTDGLTQNNGRLIVVARRVD